MERSITKIPATVNIFTADPITDRKKRRVAGYARVSTDHEEQLTSYEAQMPCRITSRNSPHQRGGR